MAQFRDTMSPEHDSLCYIPGKYPQLMRLLDHPGYDPRAGSAKDANVASDRVLTKYRLKTFAKTPYRNHIIEGQVDPANRSDNELDDDLGEDGDQLDYPRIGKSTATSTFKVIISRELATKADAATLFGSDELSNLIKNMKDLAPVAQHITDGEATFADIHDMVANYKTWKTEKRAFREDLQAMASESILIPHQVSLT